MTLVRCLLAAVLTLSVAANPALAERRSAKHRPSVSIATYRVTPPYKRPHLHATHTMNSGHHHSNQVHRSLLTGL